jgi:Mn2+/Fe2+ NRAMP family transporter
MEADNEQPKQMEAVLPSRLHIGGHTAPASWWGRFSLLDLLVVNFLTLITEFAAISLALSALGISPHILAPESAVGLTLTVVTDRYLRWERIAIALCLMDLTWFFLAFMVHPYWATAAHNSFVPTIPAGGIMSSLAFLVIAIVGTTIASWQLFFQQSCVAEEAALLYRPEMGAPRYARI